ncbi:enoyl-CoA hydratase/isomerase family protein [Croceicoccus sediminis]|uniref:enoyl-CoA hydratase/isomerase family protein n=1 Tax=Croceicoccus sediminis TaxID=2571150 RepID=UPI001182C6FD|nr:enoyl-CoA hydratase/isomerase family protein [Croceicoccus sediminis]
MATFLPDESFESYSERLSQFFKMKREDGIIEVRVHTNGAEALFGLEMHRAFAQMFRAVGADRENEVMILTGTGDHWVKSVDPDTSVGKEIDGKAPPPFTDIIYDTFHIDGTKIVEEMIWSVNIPVIAAMNGPGFHAECPLLADITLCTPDTTFVEPHFTLGLVPGDGNFLILQELMGMKRANKAMYLGQPVTADQALDWGLVTDIVPRDDLMKQAWAMARHLMARPREVRGFTTNVARQRWKSLFTREFALHLSHEVTAALIRPVHIDGQPDVVSGKTGYFEMK